MAVSKERPRTLASADQAGTIAPIRPEVSGPNQPVNAPQQEATPLSQRTLSSKG